jgi:hypothetical protein
VIGHSIFHEEMLTDILKSEMAQRLHPALQRLRGKMQGGEREEVMTQMQTLATRKAR